MTDNLTIALLGQPNSGKTTLFNELIGSRQHAGIVTGKAVEKKDGIFTHNEKKYTVVDLPSSYSLSAHSKDEIFTRDFIANAKADIVCILVDASQIEKTMWMLADFAGMKIPAIVLLNAMDVAAEQGKVFDVEKIQEQIGIPVIPFTATNKNEYEKLFETIERMVEEKSLLKEDSLYNLYQKEFSTKFDDIKKLLPENGIGIASSNWIASKLIEKDTWVLELVKSTISEENWNAINSIIAEIQDGSLLTGNCKFSWITGLIKTDVKNPAEKIKQNKFDNFATSKTWGKPFAIFVILASLAVSMVIAIPFIALGFIAVPMLATVVSNALVQAECPMIIISLINTIVFSGI